MKEEIKEANSKNVLKCVREGTNFNFKTPRGFIYMVGGILSKLEDGNQYICINKKWVKV
jgi:hypothetical protein